MSEHSNRISVAEWRQAGHYRQYQNLRIFCRHPQASADPGRPALLLIHGFPTASWDWYRLWPDLSQRFALSAIDMPGFGLSAKPRRLNYSIALQADLHESVAVQRQLKNTHLLVHDYGVSVAQELLARQRAGQLGFRINSCIFLNGGLFHGIHRPLLIQHLMASPLGFLLTPWLGKAALGRNMRRIFAPQYQPDDWHIDQMWALISEHKGQQVMPRLSRYLHERKHFYQRWLTALTDAAIPLRLIVGSLDPISGAHLADAYRQLIPGPDVVELNDTGHYPQLENPRAVLTACDDFWQAIGLTSTRS